MSAQLWYATRYCCERGKRLRRAAKFIVLAESKDEAIALAKGHTAAFTLPEEFDVEWDAEEYGDRVVLLNTGPVHG